MIVLVIDDDTCRRLTIHKFAEDRFFVEQLFWLTEWPTEFIKVIETNNIDVLFLDHDLGTCDVSFALAKLAYETPDKLYKALKNVTVIIHSMNNPGACAIKGILESLKIPTVYQFPLCSMK